MTDLEPIIRLAAKGDGNDPEVTKVATRLRDEGTLTQGFNTDFLTGSDATDPTVAGIWGALRPVEQLQAIFGYRNAYLYPERVFLPGIGKLKVSERPARTGRNPQTGKSIEIAAKKVVKLVPAKALTDGLN